MSIDRSKVWTGTINQQALEPQSRHTVGLYDTTLRDGEQTVGVVLSPEDKLELARGLDELGIERIEAGFPDQPTHPIAHGVGARAHEPPYAHQAGGGTIEEGMVLAIEPGAYWEGGGGLRVEDNFLVTADGVEKLSSYPDDFR